MLRLILLSTFLCAGVSAFALSQTMTGTSEGGEDCQVTFSGSPASPALSIIKNSTTDIATGEEIEAKYYINTHVTAAFKGGGPYATNILFYSEGFSDKNGLIPFDAYAGYSHEQKGNTLTDITRMGRLAVRTAGAVVSYTETQEISTAQGTPCEPCNPSSPYCNCPTGMLWGTPVKTSTAKTCMFH